LIYGISQFQDSGKEHLAEKISPVKRGDVSKEWLEQVIGNVRPRITGVVIHAVEVSSAPDDVCYIVEIPRSNTAHQANDKKYYRRYNFESVPMEDYEIRLVMNRLTMPELEITNIRCNLSAREDWINTSPTHQSQARYIDFNFQVFYENLSLVWAKALSYGFVGWLNSKRTGVSNKLAQYADFESPELNSRFPSTKILNLVTKVMLKQTR
jgi:hypothetical protein